MTDTGASSITHRHIYFAGTLGSGWLYCDYSSAGVTLRADTNYKVAVVNGAASVAGFWNSATLDYWSAGEGGSGISAGPLSAPNEADATSPGQSTYNLGPEFTYPATYDTGGAPTYWVDVEVTLSSAPPTSSSPPPIADSAAFLSFFP